MKSQSWRVAVLTGALLMASCDMAPVRHDAVPAEAMQSRRDAALASADWTRMTELSIEMHDYGYRPRELRLRVGQPYRLTLVNNGSVAHYFTAPEFFGSVASRKAEVRRQAEFKAPYFTSFEVYGRGGAVDFYFVPLVAGTYRAHCHMKDHLALNIEGLLIVE